MLISSGQALQKVGCGIVGLDGCLPTFFTITPIMYCSPCLWDALSRAPDGQTIEMVHYSSPSLNLCGQGGLQCRTRRRTDKPPLPKLVGKDKTDLTGSLKCAELNEDCELQLLKSASLK